MRRRTLLGGAGLVATLAGREGGRRAVAATRAVDVLLVLAVDVSRSMDEEEAQLQRAGYVAALRHPAVQAAIAGGERGAVGLCYLEWSGVGHQSLLVPWTRVAGPAGAEAFARDLAAAPLGLGTWTSISAALDRARALIAEAPFAAPRRVIDVSGDGSNNSGEPAEVARDRAIAEGIVINGLPVMRGPPMSPYGGAGVALPLDDYYRESVVGGPGAFVLPAADFSAFALAVRRKLVLEIAGAAPPKRMSFA